MHSTWLGMVAVVGLAGVASAAAPVDLPGLGVPDGAGVNIHFTDARPGEVEMLAKGGFHWVRMDFAWGGTERVKGQYDFAAYDRLLVSLAPHGIRTLFILDYNNPFYDNGLSPCSDEGRQAFAAWAAAAVRHFRGRGILWEMYNEPNIGFWKPKPNTDDFVKLALAVAKAIRAAEPDEMHIGPATSQIDLPFLEACFRAGLLDYWCAVSVHPYRQTAPETADDEYRQLRLLIAKYAPAGKTIPVLSGEWGYSAAWGSFDPVRQGRMLPRQWLTNLENEVPLSIWYDWHDDGPDPKEPEHHFGTVLAPYRQGTDPVYEPKPAYLAARTLTTELAGCRYAVRLAVGSAQDHVLVFARGDEVRVAAWTVSAAPHAATIPASPGRFRAVGHTGEALPALTAGAGGLSLTLSESPVYLTPEAPNDLLRLAAACTRVPLEVAGRGPGAAKVGFRLTNVLGRPLRVTVPPGRTLDLAPGQATDVGVDVAFGRSVEPLPLRLECGIGGLGRLAQESVAITLNPLQANLLPTARDGVSVRVVNPSADAFTGQVRLTAISGVSVPVPVAALNLVQGQTEATVPFAVTGDVAVSWGAGVQVADADGQVVLTVPATAFAPVADFAALPVAGLGQAFQVVPDGDAKIGSSQELALVEPPQPCPAGPGRVLRLTYRFDEGWKFVRVVAQTDAQRAIAGQPRSLGLWVWGDGRGNLLRLRFVDAQGEVFQPGGHAVTWTGWRYVTMPMDGRESGHWGEKSDGVVQYPIRWDTLALLDSAQRQKTEGTLYLAAPSLAR